MQVEKLEIPEVLLITPKKFGDARGFFSETWVARRYEEIGVTGNFVQDNHSLSRDKGVIRGLHCQIAPSIQDKLVRVVRGSIWDVAVDIRQGSPSFGKHVAAVLSADNWQQLWIPGGFLHGFCTLEPDTEVVYKVTAPYDSAAERGITWDDPDLALPWPIAPEDCTLSPKDAALPRFSAIGDWFQFPGAI